MARKVRVSVLHSTSELANEHQSGKSKLASLEPESHDHGTPKPAHPDSSSSGPSLESLPVEVRLMIYDNLFPESTIFVKIAVGGKRKLRSGNKYTTAVDPLRPIFHIPNPPPSKRLFNVEEVCFRPEENCAILAISQKIREEVLWTLKRKHGPSTQTPITELLPYLNDLTIGNLAADKVLSLTVPYYFSAIKGNNKCKDVRTFRDVCKCVSANTQLEEFNLTILICQPINQSVTQSHSQIKGHTREYYEEQEALQRRWRIYHLTTPVL
ncbi:MAG: hypothetical protein MMC33_002743 [Icmadophila ericetorum]|nr:hypothetical protein [Icmadophila ericetorum]